ncbi:hypothetical protein AYI68_g779 [Smittium mucronatum]|uniref:Uncharacterized protein n=1 Tax=Smittium mucronatum TaxID=133383 RepID=A0A1R0H7E8_9FUNG|nr:hypothetical protein AYI68_g779 [Smittium mucronatum]
MSFTATPIYHFGVGSTSPLFYPTTCISITEILVNTTWSSQLGKAILAVSIGTVTITFIKYESPGFYHLTSTGYIPTLEMNSKTKAKKRVGCLVIYRDEFLFIFARVSTIFSAMDLNDGQGKVDELLKKCSETDDTGY